MTRRPSALINARSKPTSRQSFTPPFRGRERQISLIGPGPPPSRNACEGVGTTHLLPACSVANPPRHDSSNINIITNVTIIINVTTMTMNTTNVTNACSNVGDGHELERLNDDDGGDVPGGALVSGVCVYVGVGKDAKYPPEGRIEPPANFRVAEKCWSRRHIFPRPTAPDFSSAGAAIRP